MTCALDRPAPQVLFDRYRDMFSATVIGGAPVIPASNEWYVVQNDYAVAEEFYAIAEQQWRERDPRTACCDNLLSMAAIDGLYPRAAAFAKGYVKVTGTAGTAIPSPLIVLFGQSYYRTDPGATVPSVMPVEGFVVVRMVADEPGVAGNGNGSGATSGTLVSPVPGLDQTVTIYGGAFCGGAPAEDCETFRIRYLARKQFKPRGNYEYIAEKIKEWPCVTRVCLRDCNCCKEIGQMDLFVFFDGTFEHGIAPPNVIADLTNWYFGSPQGFGLGQAEWGVYGSFHSATPIPVDVKVTGIPCTSSAQLAEIKARIAAMFEGICPGKPMCRKMIDAIVIQVIGAVCDFEVTLKPQGTAVAFCEDYNPDCDELPVAGVISVSGGSLSL